MSSQKFKGKYRIPSARLKNYDYSSNGAYFITICTANINFGWQSRFYDHIVRNEMSLHNIRNYIINNPKKWDSDRHNNEVLGK